MVAKDRDQRQARIREIEYPPGVAMSSGMSNVLVSNTTTPATYTSLGALNK